MLPPAVLMVDPGGMTGLAELYTGGPEVPCQVFQCSELPFFQACARIEQICGTGKYSLAIGWERFTINAETHKKTRQGSADAMHVIGVCRYLAFANKCRVIPERQQHTPDKADQARLKRLGWWVPGENDAQSAAAHMLRWLIEQNELTPQQREHVYST